MYKKKKWLDKAIDAATGKLVQHGTPLSAGNFNNMEEGISDAHIASSIILIALENSVGGKVEDLEAILSEFEKDLTELEKGLNKKAPAYTYGTEDLIAGSSPLATGTLHFVYE